MLQLKMALLGLLILAATFAFPISSLKFETRQFINKGNRLQNEIKIKEPIRLTIKPDERQFSPNYRKISLLSPFSGMFVLFEKMDFKCVDAFVRISNNNYSNRQEFCLKPNNTNEVTYEATNSKVLYFDLIVRKSGLSIPLDVIVIPTLASNCSSKKDEVRVQNSCFEKRYHDEFCDFISEKNLKSLNCPGKKTSLFFNPSISMNYCFY